MNKYRISIRDWFRRYGEAVLAILFLACLFLFFVCLVVLAFIDTFHLVVLVGTVVGLSTICFIVSRIAGWLMKDD